MDASRTLSSALLRASPLRILPSSASTFIGSVAGGLFLALFSAPVSFADTIVSVTDAQTSNRSSFFLGGQYSNVVATSWMQRAFFSNVTIDALLASVDPSFRSSTAYLMSAVGPGTTSASEVAAPVDFTVPLVGEPIPLTVLFSGLSLGPGTYYLVLSAPFRNQPNGSDLFWQIPNDPEVTTAAGVTLGSAFEADTTRFPADPFPPASSFAGTTWPMFDVTGVNVPNVPEPSTLFLLGTGLLGLVGAVRRKLLR